MMQSLPEPPAAAPEFGDEAIIAAEQISQGRRPGIPWLVGCLAWIGGATVLCAVGAAAWFLWPAAHAEDVAIYRRQRAILVELEAASGNPAALSSLSQRYSAEMDGMARDLARRLSSSAPHRKFLMWNAKYRVMDMSSADRQQALQAVKDYKSNLKQAAQYLRLKD